MWGSYGGSLLGTGNCRQNEWECPPERAIERYKALQRYTVLLVAVGKIGIGNIDWFPESDVRQNVILRDAAGHEYSALPKVSADAQLGSMGQNCVILFFPAANSMAERIANPLSPKIFQLQLRNSLQAKTEPWNGSCL